MGDAPQPDISDLLARNRAWAEGRSAADPGVFERSAAGQSPAYFWIGCSDSRAPAEAIVGLGPGEMFVHRNVANLAPADDPNFLATLQYAVQVLKVRHVLVVGHYACGGVKAALAGAKLGRIDHWLAPLHALAREHAAELVALPDEVARWDRLCELNVLRQASNVAANPFVREAWAAGAELAVHGWCYALATGLLKDLGVTVTASLAP